MKGWLKIKANHLQVRIVELRTGISKFLPKNSWKDAHFHTI
jgi:hypothetical protein